ncbi:MAG: phospholipase D-like domain-containing protein, partial [Gammaproteobacteria bacterium]|nr:phospholipase D-like domain-containing protein [Gammaproteobacteria bacterium]
AWRSFAYLNHRNHRKLLVVDERCAYLGGFNIHRESSRRAVGAERWRDSQLGFTGALVEEAARIFDLLWRGDRAWQMAKPDEAGTYLLSNHSWRNRRRLWRVFAYRFRRAHKRIYLTTPYFMPDSRTQHELMLAARRGVDVKLLLPGKKSDRWLTRYAARAAYRRLLDAGVQIFEYLPRMLHAKTVTIDGNWATIGTANMDYRSFFVNFELNLVTRNKALCEHLEHDFANDLRDSAAIDSARWGMRNRLARLIERFAWSIRRWM